MAQIDLRNSTIKILDGASHSLTIKVGEGNLTYSEKRQIDFVKRRGVLDTVRDNEEVPLELSLAFIWEFLTSDTGEPITVEDALKKRNGAASWTSTASDSLAPYCVDIEVAYTPVCAGSAKETITFTEVHWIELAHSLKDGTVAIQANCNCTEPTVVRG